MAAHIVGEIDVDAPLGEAPVPVVSPSSTRTASEGPTGRSKRRG